MFKEMRKCFLKYSKNISEYNNDLLRAWQFLLSHITSRFSYFKALIVKIKNDLVNMIWKRKEETQRRNLHKRPKEVIDRLGELAKGLLVSAGILLLFKTSLCYI